MCIRDRYWAVEATEMLCEDHTVFTDVQNQIECQTKCESTFGCPGIVYSSVYPQYCYVCMNDVLSSTFEFGFYRKPGESELECHREINKYT